MEKDFAMWAKPEARFIVSSSMANSLRNVWETLRTPFEWLRKYYGRVLEREVSMRQTWQLIHAQVAFVCAVFPVDGSLLLRLACFVWLFYTLRVCRQSLR